MLLLLLSSLSLLLSLYQVMQQLFVWKWRFLADMPTFTPTKRIFLDSQIISHWHHFEAQLVCNNIWKKIGILLTEFLTTLISIYKSKLLVIRFSSHTIRRTKSPPQSNLALRKYSSTKSYLLFYLKATPVGLSVATMYGNVQNCVWLSWQPFKSRSLNSWWLFVTTLRRNTELLVHNHHSYH